MIYSSINNIIFHEFVYIHNNFVESVMGITTRVVAIALLALGCLTALYFAYQCCSGYKETNSDSLSPKSSFSEDVFFSPYSGSHFSPRIQKTQTTDVLNRYFLSPNKMAISPTSTHGHGADIIDEQSHPYSFNSIFSHLPKVAWEHVPIESPVPRKFRKEKQSWVT